MAPQPSSGVAATTDTTSGAGHRDTITTILMMAAASAAIGGFAVLFSLWWRSNVADSYEVLRIAAQEFVAGRPIAAGELAQTVRFEGESDALPNNASNVAPFDVLPPESSGNQDVNQSEVGDESSETLTDAEADQKADAETIAQWKRLRDFLIGAGKVASALEESDRRERRKMLIDAVVPLQASRDEGFPPGRQTEGYRMLGQAFYALGRFPEAADAMNVVIQRDPTLQRALLPLLAESLRRSGENSAPMALSTIDQYLSEPTLTLKEQWLGQIIRIRSLLRLKRFAVLDDEVDVILRRPLTSEIKRQGEEIDFRDKIELFGAVSKVQRAIDRYGAMPQDALQDRSDAIAELSQPIEVLGELQREAAPQTSALARLWLARAYLIEGRVDDGLSRLTAVRGQRPFGAVSTLAGVEEIELLASQGRGVEVLQTTRYMIREIGDESGFDADEITFVDFRRRLIDAVEDLRRSGDFANAIDTARSMPPLFEVSEALMQEAIGYRQWAEATVQDGTDGSGELSRAASELSRSLFRASGDAFARAAEIKFDTNEYLPAQWAAIDAYQQGRHFQRSIRLLQPYLRYEERLRQPRGLVAYSRALLAEGDEEKAIEAAEACIIEYPRDPQRYDARLLAAKAHAERQELDRAGDYLMDNIRDGELTPQSPAWRDSLVMLGQMRYEQAYQNHLTSQLADGQERVQSMRDNQPLLKQAIRYLEETVQRYQLPFALDSAYLAARAHMLAADWPRVEAESPEILEAAKRSLRAQADQELQVALDSFVILRQKLVAREEENLLPPKEDVILRNCFLAEADILRQIGRLEEASTAYRTVELRYLNEPTSLEAILGRAACAKALGRQREADLLVRQASVVLSRIPADWDDRFAETTRFDRNGWQQYLTWMSSGIPNGDA